MDSLNMSSVSWIIWIVVVVHHTGRLNGEQKRSYENINGCFWNVHSPCYLDCMSGDSDHFPAVIREYHQMTKNECNGTGIILKIGSLFKFPKRFVMTTKWLQNIDDIRISELTVDSRDFEEIEPDAFSTDAFSNLSVLNFEVVRENMFQKHSLRGLPRLRTLNLFDCTSRVMGSELLDGVSATLSSFSLMQQSSINPSVFLNPVLGTTPMLALREVRILRNLDGTLNAGTFTGLRNLTLLNLSQCQIQTIGPGAFDAIAATIRELNLRGNLLTTLPVGLLDAMILRPQVRLALNNNWWECDCNLCYTKWLMVNARNPGVQGELCRSPAQFRSSPINETQFCELSDCDVYSVCEREENAALPECAGESPETPSESSPVDEVLQQQQCLAPDGRAGGQVSYGRRKYSMLLRSVNFTTARVELALPEPKVAGPSEAYLVWFEGNANNSVGLAHPVVGCAGCQQLQFDWRDGGRTAVLVNLQMDVSYMFCVMGGGNVSQGSPLDCVSYKNAKKYDPNEQGSWLNGSDKSVSISMMVLATVSSLLLGICLGYMMMRCYPTLLSAERSVIVVQKEQKRPPMEMNEYDKAPACMDTRRISICSSQSYAMPTNELSRFDIIRRKLEKQTSENQYYLENMPKVDAPRPPTMTEETASATEEERSAMRLPEAPVLGGNDNIYSDVSGYVR